MHKMNRNARFFAGMAAVLLFPLISAAAAVAETPLPRFADYPVKEWFTGKPVPPDFKNDPDAKRFATRIREGATKGPNFAGRYTIIEWGCGSECQSFAIVDAKTGAIFSPPFSTAWGMMYRLDSSLLIVNPVTPEAAAGDWVPGWLVTGFYVWDGSQLNKVQEDRPLVIDPQTGAASAPESLRK